MENATGSDKLRSFLVFAATIGMIAFNALAATGGLGGAATGDISAKYSSVITPAGYAFSIWTLIYVGMMAFSVYQIVPANLVSQRPIRSLYITSCALNVAWLYFWHAEQIAICFVLLAALAFVLYLINRHLITTDSTAEYWIVKLPFGLYFGWVTAATIVNLAILAAAYGLVLGDAVGAVLVLIAGAFGVLMRFRLANYFYPLAVAWACTAIAVKQGSHTLIVVACAVATIACLIASLSFVVNMPTQADRFGQGGS
jgi:hypothetical protein